MSSPDAPPPTSDPEVSATDRAGATTPPAGDVPADEDLGGVPADEDLDEQISPFPHPPWTVGLVLVAGVITLLFGLLVSPVWLVVGSPFVVVLVLWLYVRLFVRP